MPVESLDRGIWRWIDGASFRRGCIGLAGSTAAGVDAVLASEDLGIQHRADPLGSLDHLFRGGVCELSNMRGQVCGGWLFLAENEVEFKWREILPAMEPAL